MNSFADPFRLKLDTISSHGVDFLDITLKFGERWRQTGMVDIMPFRKESSIWLPLSSGSLHPPRLHEQWPLAMQRRFNLHSTDQKASSAFIETWLEEFRRVQPFHVIFQSQEQRSYPKPTPTERKQRVWLVVPYTIHWAAAGFTKAIRQIEQTAGRLWSSVPYNTAISWRLGGMPLHTRLQMASQMSAYMQEVTTSAIRDQYEAQRRRMGTVGIDEHIR